MIRHVLFDMDGVLINSERAIRIACIKALAEYNVQANDADFKEFTGMGEARFIGGVAEKYGLAYKPEMKSRAYELYADVAAENVDVYPGIPELLDELHERGITFALASSADLVKVKINLACMGVSPEKFAALVTGSDIKNLKPAPDIFIEAARRIGAKPDETVVVEDALSGLEAAKAAGMRSVGITSSFSSELLINAGAEYTLDMTMKLCETLKAMDELPK